MRVPEFINLTNYRYEDEHESKHRRQSNSNNCQMDFIADGHRFNSRSKVLQIEQHYHSTNNEKSTDQ